jgi:hypothetical protein
MEEFDRMMGWVVSTDEGTVNEERNIKWMSLGEQGGKVVL